MELAFVIEKFNPYRGGAETYAYQLASHLIRKGHSIKLITKEYAKSIPQELEVITSKCQGNFSLAGKIFFLIETKHILNQLKPCLDLSVGFSPSLSIDIYRNGGGVHIGYQKHALMPINNPLIRVIKAWERKLRPRNIFTQILEKHIFENREMSKIICNSKWSKSLIQKYYSMPESKIKVIYNAVDTDRFVLDEDLRREWRESLGIGSKDLVYLFVSTNFRLKGLDFLLDAFRLLRQNCTEAHNTYVLAVGQHRYRRYERLAAKKGLSKNVIFLRRQHDMKPLYSVSDVLIHPSFYDSFSNACMEAMASGLPLITTLYNGVSEIITPNEEGVLLQDPKDTEKMAEYMSVFLDRHILEEMGYKARNLALQFNWKDHVNLLEGLFFDVIQTR